MKPAASVDRPQVLIVKLSGIGDVIMALCMLEPIRDRWPDANVTWICGRAARPIVSRLEGVDEVVVADESVILRGSPVARARLLLQLWSKLAFRRFDLVLMCYRDKRYRVLTMPVRTRAYRSFGADFPLAGRLHHNEYRRLVTQNEGANTDVASLPLHLYRPLELAPESAAARALEATPGKRVALAPGGAQNNDLARHYLRRWPLERYVELARELLSRGYEVLLTGGVDDSWILPAFHGMNVRNLVGKTQLLELIEVYRNCDAVVVHDSGPLHLASLAGTRIVSLFGPTNPAQLVIRRPGVVALWGGAELACRPCYDGRAYAICDRNLCMESLQVSDVLECLLKLLAARAAP